MSWVLAPSLLPPAAINLAFLEMILIGAFCWPDSDSAEAWAEALGGGTVRPRFAADMVLAIEGGGESGAKANLTSFKFEPKTATQ